MQRAHAMPARPQGRLTGERCAGFGLFKVVTGPTVVTTLSISLVWLIYTAIPPYLLLHYHFIGRGQMLRWACRVSFWISSLCGIAAIVLLWLVYPRQARPAWATLLPMGVW